ncbi:DUF3152 domain-containing protein [Euzebya sp.]|uniref:DUF3152 domain-containing protein n=1 Tax=Euzebya sp. TaxID=1971409 RepID=UPI003512DA58
MGRPPRLLAVAVIALAVIGWAGVVDGGRVGPERTGGVGARPSVAAVSSATATPAPTVPPTPAPTVEPSAAEPADAVVVIPYRIELATTDPAVADALEVIPAVLEDPRGWQQAGFDFVLEPDAPHVIVLAEGPDAQRLCEPYDVGEEFSCQIGARVVLNAIRWREAVPHWPDLGAGGLATYRTMLINHEVGHLLGMHHLRCTTPGAVAPVMEQQSGTLRGCTANAWPTAVELRLAATHQFELAPGPLDVPFEP